jgi:hypothetical protein
LVKAVLTAWPQAGQMPDLSVNQQEREVQG